MTDDFPHLLGSGFEETSPATSSYNCIAWAAGEDFRWWWPDPMETAFWPSDAPRQETLRAFVSAFALSGYEISLSADLEPGWEKVAIYCRDGVPTYAARQLPDGRWTSKLGHSIDIAHQLSDIAGPLYGAVTKVLRRNSSGVEKK